MKILFLVSAWCVLITGCTQERRGDTTIDSSSTLKFAIWRSKVGAEFTPKEWAAFDVALQEIRYEAMAAGFSGSASIDSAVRELIDGQTVEYVVQRGLNRKLNRYIRERDEQKKVIDREKPLGSLPDIEENAQVARSVRAAQIMRYEKITEEISKIEDALALIDKGFGSRD